MIPFCLSLSDDTPRLIRTGHNGNIINCIVSSDVKYGKKNKLRLKARAERRNYHKIIVETLNARLLIAVNSTADLTLFPRVRSLMKVIMFGV